MSIGHSNPAGEERIPDTGEPTAPDRSSLQEIERVIAAIWAELVGVPSVGPTANFLELGGESLLAAEAIQRIRDRFGFEIPVRLVFVETVAEVAMAVASRQKDMARG